MESNAYVAVKQNGKDCGNSKCNCPDLKSPTDRRPELKPSINVVTAFNSELPGNRYNRLINSHEKMFTMILGG
jgi:hypothetical protein